MAAARLDIFSFYLCALPYKRSLDREEIWQHCSYMDERADGIVHCPRVAYMTLSLYLPAVKGSQEALRPPQPVSFRDLRLAILAACPDFNERAWRRENLLGDVASDCSVLPRERVTRFDIAVVRGEYILVGRSK